MLLITRLQNHFEWYGNGNSSKRCPLSLQYMPFCPLKDNLLHHEMMPFANLSGTSEDRKQKLSKNNRS